MIRKKHRALDRLRQPLLWVYPLCLAYVYRAYINLKLTFDFSLQISVRNLMKVIFFFPLSSDFLSIFIQTNSPIYISRNETPDGLSHISPISSQFHEFKFTFWKTQFLYQGLQSIYGNYPRIEKIVPRFHLTPGHYSIGVSNDTRSLFH